MNIQDLNFDKKNYNRGTEQGDKLLDKSIRKFGYRQPAVIDKNGNIVAGNKRIAKAGELGIDEVNIVKGDPKKITVIQYDDFDLVNDKLTKEYALADNQVAKVNIEIDTDVVVDDLGEEVAQDWRVELSEVIEPNGHDDINDEMQTLVKSVRGDLYEFTINDCKHRILCGDSTIIGEVDKLMGGEKADMVFTDPPYGVSYANKNKYLNSVSRGNRIQKEIANDHMSLDETKKFIYEVFLNVKLILKEYSTYYITAPQGGDLMMMMMMMMMMMEAGIPLRHCLIWVKNNHVLGRTDYNYKHEPILYGWVDKHKHYGKGDHKFSTWEIDKPLKNDLHPTMKPVELIVNALLNSTQKGMLCVDLFGGSGSTAIACVKTGRNSNLMELDEHYVDVIVTRVINYCKDNDIMFNLTRNDQPAEY